MSLTIQDKELEFYMFVYERHSIYCKRSAGLPKPWTDFPILQKYRFCNVFRELDRLTQHLIKNVIDNKKLTLQDKFLNIAVFRIFNRDGFFTNILSEPLTCASYMPEDLIDKLDYAMSKKIKVWGNAYMVCGLKTRKNIRSKDKHVQVAYGIWDSLEDGAFSGILPESAEHMFMRALHIKYIGPFLAYQIMADMSYIKGIEFFDMNSFMKIGPGAVATIRRIYGEDVDWNEYNKVLYYRQEACFKELKEKFGMDFGGLLRGDPKRGSYRSVGVNPKLPVRLSDVENCACEFRKFTNLRQGIKQRKRIHTPLEEINHA